MEKITLSKYEDAMRMKMMDIFKEDYKNFIYANNWPMIIEYAMQTASTIFWLQYWNVMTNNTAEQIRKFMLKNMSQDREWKNRLIRPTV